MPHPQVLRDMALFVEVAKRRSFSQAAAALGMPISSLSRRIALFESAVGLRLLDRTTRKLVLTSYGEAYLAQATRLVDEAQRSFDELVAQGKGPSGFLKVAVPSDAWVLRHLSDLIAQFSREHEHVHVHIDLKPAAVDLAGEGYDLAIAISEPTETSLIVRKVGELENGLYAARTYLMAHGHPEHPADLERHQIILPNEGTSASWNMTRGRDVAAVTVCGQVSCNSPSLARRFVLAGQGITPASRINVHQDVTSGRLEQVLPEWRLPPTPIYILTTSRLLPAKTRSFIDFVMKRLGAILADAAKTALPDGAARDGTQALVAAPAQALRA